MINAGGFGSMFSFFFFSLEAILCVCSAWFKGCSKAFWLVEVICLLGCVDKGG